METHYPKIPRNMHLLLDIYRLFNHMPQMYILHNENDFEPREVDDFRKIKVSMSSLGSHIGQPKQRTEYRILHQRAQQLTSAFTDILKDIKLALTNDKLNHELLEHIIWALQSQSRPKNLPNHKVTTADKPTQTNTVHSNDNSTQTELQHINPIIYEYIHNEDPFHLPP